MSYREDEKNNLSGSVFAGPRCDMRHQWSLDFACSPPQRDVPLPQQPLENTWSTEPSMNKRKSECGLAQSSNGMSKSIMKAGERQSPEDNCTLGSSDSLYDKRNPSVVLASHAGDSTQSRLLAANGAIKLQKSNSEPPNEKEPCHSSARMEVKVPKTSNYSDERVREVDLRPLAVEVPYRSGSKVIKMYKAPRSPRFSWPDDTGRRRSEQGSIDGAACLPCLSTLENEARMAGAEERVGDFGMLSISDCIHPTLMSSSAAGVPSATDDCSPSFSQVELPSELSFEEVDELVPLQPRASSTVYESDAKDRRAHCKWSISFVVTFSYTVLLVLVALLSFLPTYFVMEHESTVVFNATHEATRAQVINNIVSILLLPELFATEISSLYQVNPTEIHEQDRLIPIEGAMLQRLCGTLKFGDPFKYVLNIQIVSMLREQYVVCSRDPAGTFLFGSQTNNTEETELKIIDEDTLHFTFPYVYHGWQQTGKMSSYVYTSGAGNILYPWVAAVNNGETYSGGYWTYSNRTTSRLRYVYPFLERSGGQSGYGFIEPVLDSAGLLKRVRESLNSTDTDVRVMVTYPWNRTVATSPLILSVNWDQEVLNTTKPWPAAQTGVAYWQLTTAEVSDSLMQCAVKHIDKSLFVGDFSGIQRVEFTYEGYRAIVTLQVLRISTELSVVVVVASPQVMLTQHVYSQRNWIVAGIVVSVVVVAAAVFAVVHVCVQRPLSEVVTELSLTAAAANVNENRPTARFVMHEIHDLQYVCVELRRHLQAIRAYLPAGLVTLETPNDPSANSTALRAGSDSTSCSPHNGDCAGAALKRSGSRRQHAHRQVIARGALEAGRGATNDFRERLCSVLYVYFPAARGSWRMTQQIDTLVKASVGNALHYGGCVESLQPDCITISFGAVKEQALHALSAARCALAISRLLPSALRQMVALAVDTQHFLCGTCGVERRKALVVVGRDVSAAIGSLQLHIQANVCVTEECAAHLRGKVRMLPVEVVYLDSAQGTRDSFASSVASPYTPTAQLSRCKLLELFSGAADSSKWAKFAELYSHGFQAMERGEYASAVRLLTEAMRGGAEAGGVSLRTEYEYAQLVRRLVKESESRIQSGNLVPYVRRPWHARDKRRTLQNGTGARRCSRLRSVNPAENSVESSSVLSSIAEVCAPRPAANDSLMLPILLPVKDTDRFHIQCSIPWVCDPSVVVSSHAHCNVQALQAELIGSDGVVWHRSRDIARVIGSYVHYLAISATGTLATMKAIPRHMIVSAFPEYERWCHAWKCLKEASEHVSIHYLDHIQTDNYIVFIAEFVPGGTLKETIERYGKRLPFSTVRQQARELFRSFALLAANGIVHGNFNSENALTSMGGSLRIQHIDVTANVWGYEEEVKKGLRRRDVYGIDRVTCVRYSAPEVAQGGERSTASDVFAAGLVLLCALSAQVPWQWSASITAEERADLGPVAKYSDEPGFAEMIARGDVEPIQIPDLPLDLQQVVTACCREDPAERCTAAEALAMINAPR